MAKRDMSEEQIMADILNRLINAGMWGKGHHDVDQLKKWLSGKLKKDGKMVTRAIGRLNSEQLVGVKNNGRSIYANPRKRHEISDFVKTHYVDDWNAYLREKQENEEQKAQE